jgi:SAM-dependent methyltransferase
MAGEDDCSKITGKMMMNMLKNFFRRFWNKHKHASLATEPLMYRVHLFNELLARAGRDFFASKRILEIGPKDGLDSKRLASLQPEELIMIDLPEKNNMVHIWLDTIPSKKRYIERNFLYMPHDEILALGRFDLIWCTGVLYHNAEQLRFLRKLYKLLRQDGYLVLESATLRQSKELAGKPYVEIHYPETYRNTGTVTHLPSASAIRAWLQMVGFQEIIDSTCYEKENKDLAGQRYACIARKSNEDDADIYYGKSGFNPLYKFGEST